MITKLISPDAISWCPAGQCRPFGATPQGQRRELRRVLPPCSRRLARPVHGRPGGAAGRDSTRSDHQQDRRRLAYLRRTTCRWTCCTATASTAPLLPEKGHRFNPRVVLLDPYRKAISGGHQWGVADVPYGKDSGQLTRRSRLVLDDFDWEGDHPLATPHVGHGHLRAARSRLHPASVVRRAAIPAPSSACARRSRT